MPKQGQYSDAHLEGFILDTNAQINRRRPKLEALGNITGKECGATDGQIAGLGTETCSRQSPVWSAASPFVGGAALRA